MIKDALQKLIPKEHKSLATYDLMRLHAKTYRMLKNHMSDSLGEHDLSTLDWSLMGIVNQYKAGCRYMDLAEKMGVEPPFITELVNNLQEKHYLKTENDPKDGRAKLVKLTSMGRRKLQKLESELQKTTATLFANVSDQDYARFTHVIYTVSNKDGSRE